jgi:Flp pilus assembly protein TadG
MKLRKCGMAHRRGAALVETTFVLLIAFTLTFAIYDYSRFFMLSQLVNNAAREGARQAVVNTNTQNTTMIQNTVVQYLAGQSFTDSSGNAFSAADVVVTQVNPATGLPTTPDSNWYDAPFGSTIKVQVNAKFTSLFPTFGFMPKTVNLQGTAVMSSEGN